jgi:hypothetical protein
MHFAAASLRSLFPLGLATKEIDQLPLPKVGPVGRIARELASLRVQLGKLLGRDSMGHNFPETVSSSDEAPLHSLPVFGLTAVLGDDRFGIWSRNLFGEKRDAAALRSPPRSGVRPSPASDHSERD